MFGFKSRRRKRIRARAFPTGWLNIIQRNVPYYQRLRESDQRELQGDVLVFLDEKRFEGCGGLEINDEIRVTIAALASILLLHRENDDYPLLQSILVYPRAYMARGIERTPEGLIQESVNLRGGESWHRGAVVLSWDDVKKTASDIHDGHNVALHEFAHQLDQEDGDADGAPILKNRSRYLAWARVLGEEYHHLLEEIENHSRTDIDTYGATNPAEFFAVITELFFEKPVQFKRRHPELYHQLQLFYRQDPAADQSVTNSIR
jgi:MtfA peptidase